MLFCSAESEILEEADAGSCRRRRPDGEAALLTPLNATLCWSVDEPLLSAAGLSVGLPVGLGTFFFIACSSGHP